MLRLAIPLLLLSPLQRLAAADPVDVEPAILHIRQADPREWSEFPDEVDARQLDRQFTATANSTEYTLRLRQENVKQTWDVTLNGKRIHRLVQDENPMVLCLPIPPKALRDGDNTLTINTRSDTPDDIRLGQIQILPQPVDRYLHQAEVTATVIDASTGKPTPCRLTVLNDDGAMQTNGAKSNHNLAVRPGVIYTGNGSATFGLPPGKYRIYAGRGPEYGVAEQTVNLKPGDAKQIHLTIDRQVDTRGWISCDTHVHTLTHSGHGDASIEERMITLAGEAVEFPIATDHNKQIDYVPIQESMGLTHWFTSVVGNEVTTKTGHFNIFPAPAGGPVPDYKGDWKATFKSIRETADPAVIILNHARDLHSGFRPFGPRHRHPLTGRQLDGWTLEANAMEVVNSGAQQTDILQLPRDWMVNLNRGLLMTPVGCSDSHDVARHFVGQGRTCIQCDDSAPGNIDIAAAVKSFREGRVIVSCGLFPEMTALNKFGPGGLIPKQPAHRLRAHVRVQSPLWCDVDAFTIYVNGEPAVEKSDITPADKDSAVKVAQNVDLQLPPHDCHLVLVATGPGVREIFWPVARPYQPVSEEWHPLMFGMTGAIWYDANGDGKRNSAREIAETLYNSSGKDPEEFIAALAETHRSVCLQAAELLQLAGVDLTSPLIRQQAQSAGKHVEQAFQDYLAAWRNCEIARAKGIE